MRRFDMIRRAAVFLCFLGLMGAASVYGEAKRKIIVDQDARGPATTDQQSKLALIQAPQAEVLGLTIVSGDQWRDEEVAHTLRMLELTNHPEIKVYPGAIFPLINSKEEIARWSKLYGKVRYQGAWTKNGTGKFVREVHGPYEVPELPEGNPTLKAEAEDAAHFIIRMVHKYPHEVTIYAGGPMTNIALALSLDPKVAELAQELVVMGGSIAPEVPLAWKTENRREFNFWWDPEAVHIVVRGPGKKITGTTGIGRGSWRGRGEVSGGGGSFKKKKKKRHSYVKVYTKKKNKMRNTRKRNPRAGLKQSLIALSTL